MNTDNQEEVTGNWDANFSNNETPWTNLSRRDKCCKILQNVGKMIFILACLYLFIASLSFLADGFRLLAGKKAGEFFRYSAVFNNPVAGLMVGVLVTVLVQSSSTSTSIIITMVAADLLIVEQAIPMIMGANIGTSVTSTIVALGQIGHKNEFRRAFAAATVHDMFNLMSVCVFLPLEAATNLLTILSRELVLLGASSQQKQDILKVITNPFTKSVIQLDKKLLNRLSVEKNMTVLAELEKKSLIKTINTTLDGGKQGHLFNHTTLNDTEVGVIILCVALIILCATLYLIVRTLKNLLKGRNAAFVYRCVNGNIKDRKCNKCTCPLGWISGYLAMIAGVGLTICVQSSSITTSALTPLVGVGVLSLERMYPVVLGANIGTCITGILAALSSDGSKLSITLQVAYAHLFFNVLGIFVFYVFWPLRKLPIESAKFLGNTTAKYKWFAVIYCICVFLIVPGIFVGLSFAGLVPLLVVTGLCVAIGMFVTVINISQNKCRNRLPNKLQTWEFVPKWMRSLEPIDKAICNKIMCCKNIDVEQE